MSNMEKAKKIIKEHYNLKYEVSEGEVWAEVADLLRKMGDYDDIEKHLAAKLHNLGFGL